MKDITIMEESKAVIYKNLIMDATQFALKGDWKKAISTNKEILSLNKLDVQALNRIGKAQLELGKLKDSKKSYTKALQIDPLNTIIPVDLVNKSSKLQYGSVLSEFSKYDFDESSIIF